MSKTINEIHEELLDNISDRYQKSEGFPVWDILRSIAFGLKALWDKAFWVESQQNVDNLTGDNLARFVSQRKGLTRKEATKAVGTIRIVTGAGTITEGARFSTKGLIEFVATETKAVTAGDTVEVKAVNAGISGNVPADSITQMPVTIAGISQITNDEATIDGYEAEKDDSLRARYYEALREPATSGNVYHYRRWAREVSGVGAVKVFPLWDGDNTVQVIIIDDESQPASEELVARVQQYIDPNKAGTGEGEAPIGAYCTVSPANIYSVNVTVSVLSSIPHDTVVERIRAGLIEYLKSLAFVDDYISIGKVNNVIINTDGVLDCDELIVNGQTTRITIPEKSIAIMGVLTVNEVNT